MAKRLLKIRFIKFGTFYKILILVIIIILLAFMFIFTNSIRNEILRYNRRIVNTYARLLSLATTHSVGSTELNIIFEEIIRKVDFPIILTDSEGHIQSWRNLRLPSGLSKEDELTRVKQKLENIKCKHNPVPVYLSNTEQILGYVYFGDSTFILWLRFIPLFEVLIILGLFIGGFIIFGRIKSFEQQNIWLGMARETAHQLGTPISSLLGWSQLLRERMKKLKMNADGLVNDEKLFRDSFTPERIIDEMEKDVDLLSTIVNRFGEIGSQPKLKPIDIIAVVEEVVEYLQDRKPKLHSKIKIKKEYNPVPKVMVSRQLIKWAIENLIENSLEAIDLDGTIRVTTRTNLDEKVVNIIISDDGRGILPKERGDIFAPGYTTKKRGWGLGLSLAKRIVEDFHNGKLYLLESRPHEKTTFIIGVPIPEEE